MGKTLIIWAPVIFPLLLVGLKYSVLVYVRNKKGSSYIFESIIFSAISYDIFVIYFALRQNIIFGTSFDPHQPIIGAMILVVHFILYISCQGMNKKAEEVKCCTKKIPTKQILGGIMASLLSWGPTVLLIRLQVLS